MLLVLLARSGGARAETYVVCVGVGKYANPNVRNLTKTEADAKAMAAFFKRGTPNVITLTGRYATKARILSSLRSQFGKAKCDDKIIFYFSGHGYPGGFCPYEMADLSQGLTYAEVLKIMNQSPAASKFIFADACNSGTIRQADNFTPPRAGATIFFLSSRSNESSLESPLLANGYFTKHLLRGLSGAADSNGDRAITASELFRYVSAGVQEQSRGRQHPVMWGTFPDDLVIVSYGQK